MSSIYTHKETTEIINPDGTSQITSTTKTAKIQRNDEPDYIKLYTRMWCEFNGIPETYRGLFLELVTRMSYCNSTDLPHSQLVNTGSLWGQDIMNALGWKRSMYQRGLRELCACGAIRQMGRGVYQINPCYAGRGEWKYNPRLSRGGVEDLVATFNFRKGTVDTSIIWADDGEDTPLNESYREGLHVKPEDGTVLKYTRIEPEDDEQLPGQMSFNDIPEMAEALK